MILIFFSKRLKKIQEKKKKNKKEKEEELKKHLEAFAGWKSLDINPLMPGVNKKGHTWFQLQVCLSMCDLSVTTRH